MYKILLNRVGANVVDEFEHEEETVIYDSPKIYHTEDTPQTFSSAASLTDLRVSSAGYKSDKKSNQIVNKLQSENVSGICTPDERPVTFCEEGTPAELSRIASSFTLSIEDNDVNDISDLAINNVLQSLGNYNYFVIQVCFFFRLSYSFFFQNVKLCQPYLQKF